MKKFAHLIFVLNGTANPQVRQTELVSYFTAADADDVLWALFLLLGNRPKKQLGLNQLKTWVLEQSRLPEWLFEAALQRAGDLTTTITRVLPSPSAPSDKSLTHWLNFLHQLSNLPEDEHKFRVQAAWSELDVGERFLLNKLLTGGFRTKFLPQPLLQALATVSGVNYHLLAYRLARKWHPDQLTLAQLTAADSLLEAELAPWDFPDQQKAVSSLIDNREISNWIALRDYPGVNIQLVVSNEKFFLWSENQEFLNPRFPALTTLAAHFTGNIRILGKLTGTTGNHFYRIEHFEVKPIIMAYDILEIDEQDLRAEPYFRRRQVLKEVMNQLKPLRLVQVSQIINFENREILDKLLLSGQKKGFTGAQLYRADAAAAECWLLSAPELKITTVLLYVQHIPGQGPGKGFELTFAVQGETGLIPCARIATHLSTEDATEILDFVKKNTVEKFGPVRSIKPALVFEIAFDAVVPSGRHKAGLKLETPRIVEWRREKPLAEISKLQQLQEILRHEKKSRGVADNVSGCLYK